MSHFVTVQRAVEVLPGTLHALSERPSRNILSCIIRVGSNESSSMGSWKYLLLRLFSLDLATCIEPRQPYECDESGVSLLMR